MDNYSSEHFNRQFRGDHDPFGYYSSKYERMKYERTLNEAKRQCPPSDTETILELGCANGAFTQMLQLVYESAEITAVDFSNQALEIARNRVEGADLQKAEITEFIQNGVKKYDLIIASECLYYLTDAMTVTELLRFVDDLHGRLIEGGSIISANIYAHNRRDNLVMTEPVVDVLRVLFENQFNSVQVKSFTESKGSGSDERTHTYEIWSVKKDV